MKKIVVPTDFSEIAHNATQFAISVAKHTGAEIIFFHADLHNGSDELRKLKEEAAKVSLSNRSVKTEFVASDKLFNSITIKDIFKGSIDLIVIGTSAENADISKKLFGTNTSEIIEDINCPVIAVPANYQYKGIQKIAYASDLSMLEHETAKVIDFAKHFNAAVEIFHVSPVFPDLGDVEKLDIPGKVQQLKEKHGYSTINYFVEKTPHDNQIGKGIKSLLSHHNSDLLVLFHNNREGFDRFISSSENENLVNLIKKTLLIFPKS
jgi:nucleotide-binding universal stress UspA family protein